MGFKVWFLYEKKWHAPSFVAQQTTTKNFEQQTFFQMVKQILTNKKPKMSFFLKDDGRWPFSGRVCWEYRGERSEYRPLKWWHRSRVTVEPINHHERLKDYRKVDSVTVQRDEVKSWYFHISKRQRILYCLDQAEHGISFASGFACV